MKAIKKKFTVTWTDIKESIAGTEKDFTRVNLGKAILLLAIPMVLEMIMESVFAVVDIFFVSRLGAGAVATVGITESLMTLVYALGIGFSAATTAIVSRRVGEKREDDASVSTFQSILLGFSVSLLISVFGAIYAKDILKLMGATPGMISSGYQYTAIMLGGNGVIILLFIINAAFRGAGDAAISMRVLWMANLVNIVLDPCLIFGWGPFPEMGLKGAAIATNIGRGLAVVYQFYILFRGKTRVHLAMKHMRFRFAIIKNLLYISAGGIGQNIIATSSWIALVRIIAEFGSVVMAGYTIAIRVMIFILLPSWGLSNAAATLVGQNLGAKHPRRAERAVWITGLVNMTFLGIIGIVFTSVPVPFIRIFIEDPEVIRAGASCLRILGIGFFTYSFGMVMIQAFNGAGDTFTPTVLNFICFWLIEIPLAYTLAFPLGFEQHGVYYAILGSEALLALLSFLLFRRGKWKENEV